MRQQFATVDSHARQSIIHAGPPAPESLFYAGQIIRTAREVDFFSNLRHGTWWTRLHLTVLGQTLRYVACLQRVGPGESGVLALTVFAETLPPASGPDEARARPGSVLRSAPTDSVTLVHGDVPERRWPECGELLDRTLAAALSAFAQGLG